ncbi:DNA/RNA helicase domain-containing protein [Clostridium butyricum]|uniref:DUF2075 domain-containing protein n=1 Tax=Clostridium butyricum TaxID=1492 RepID=UPI003D34E302
MKGFIRMSTTVQPIFYKTTETDGFLENLKKDIINEVGEDNSEYILNYPTIYIHTWKSAKGKENEIYNIYVGESTDVIKRTKEHYRDSRNPSLWQNHLIADGDIPNMYIFGHKYFNKSLTLDIENKLIDYCMAMNNVNICNGRGNPQGKYSYYEYFDDIFSKIWLALRRDNPDLFLSETKIKKSAIYKASPNHKLTVDQKNAKEKIIDRVNDAIINNKSGQLIFVEGEAGTGKTVLTTSTFYELADTNNLLGKNIKCNMLVNHDEQYSTYMDMAKKLGLTHRFGEDIISKPTRFITNNNENNPVDVVFVDEAHLLWTQGKQAYRGENQLEDIIKRSKVTIVMFDPYQVLRTEQYWESELLDKFRDLAKSQNNYIELNYQLRMNCSKDTMMWIDNFTKKSAVSDIHEDSKGYEIKVFNTPEQLHEAIKKKADNENTELSRLIASYDWKYSSDAKPSDNKEYWEVEIDEWHMPWNRELSKKLSKNKKKDLKQLAWAEQPQTIDEVGSTFTIQGFDLAYAGVIIGPSVQYRDGKIVFDADKKEYKSMTNNRTFSDGKKVKVAEVLMRNELRVLMTRGTKGIYIYSCDDALRKALFNAINN